MTEWGRALTDSPVALERLQARKGWSRVALEQLGVGFDGKRLLFPIRDQSRKLLNIVKYAPNPKENECKSLALRGRPRGLFPAPESLENPELWLVEGEPDAITGASLGLAAIGVPGVKGWKPQHAQRFAGRKVVVCMDCDEPGRNVAERIACDLSDAEVEYRRVDLAPDRSDGFDLGDFLISAENAGAARNALMGLAGRAKVERPEPVPDLAQLLDSVVAVVRRFVVLGDEQLDALALWVLHTHAIAAADTTPYLAITSPEKRSGKSRLLEVLAQLVPRAMEAANVSDAALFRALGGDNLPRTLLFDEIDAVFGKKQAQSKEELRGLINAGYRKGAVAWRCTGERMDEVRPFPVFGPKALAGIGDLPDTIADRCIPIRLRRRARGEAVERGRYKVIQAAAEPVVRAAERWARTTIETLGAANPDLPDQLTDRAQDGAEPLLAIADLAGEDWAKRARASLVALHTDRASEDEDSWGVRLLGDIRAAFGTADRLSTTELLDGLKEDEEAPWGGWGKTGDGLNSRGLAKLLHPFGVRSNTIRVEGAEKSPAKGYKREQFEDAWSRYLALNGSVSVTPVTSALTSQKPDLFHPLQDPVVTDTKEGSNPHSNAVVTDVTAGNANKANDGIKPQPIGALQTDPVSATAAEEAEADRLAAKFGEQF